MIVKRYKIKGTYWQQGELMYLEALEVFTILRGRLKGAFGSVSALSNKIDEFAADRTLDKLFPLVLKVDNSTPWRRFINRRRLGDLTPANIIEQMTIDEIARVCFDFFFINASSIKRLLSLRLGSISWYQRGPTLWQAIMSILKVSSTLPGEITSKPGTSGASRQST